MNAQRRRWIVGVCAVLAAMSIAKPLYAQSTPPPQGTELGREPAAAEAAQSKKIGDAAFRARRYAEALRAYERSFALMPNPTLLFNRARTLEALERYPEAIDAFDAFVRDAPPELRERAGELGELIAALKKKVATLRVSGAPPNSRVLVRNVVVGTTPFAPLRVNAGPATIEVEADGFVRYRVERELAGDHETIEHVALLPKTGVLAIERAPSGARVSVDGVETSTAENRVAAGPHLVRIEADGRSEDRSVVVLAGQRAIVSLAVVQERRPITERWWFWAGAGVLVATGAAVAVVLTTRSPELRSGDLGQVTAPLYRF